MRLIAFTGLKGSGKDTAASVFVDLGYEHVKMAGCLKGMLRAMLAYQLVDEATIDRMIDGDLKEAPSALLGGRSPRHAMQTLGTEWGRDLMTPTLWADLVRSRCAAFAKVVISDVRFPNEVDLVRSMGGKVYRVERGLAADDLHPSERLVLELDVDGVILNDQASAEDFREYVLGGYF